MKCLAASGHSLNALLYPVYGAAPEVIFERLSLLHSVLESFLTHFGDLPIRIFRSPGRINVRGMHVDTHGGYLNLMTHQREIMIVTAQAPDDTCIFANTDPRFGKISFRLKEIAPDSAIAKPWLEFITEQAIEQHLKKGEWTNYVQGAMARACRSAGKPIHGIFGVIGSDLPQGAALSSSHALCAATLWAALSWNTLTLSPDDLILAIRDAEWYTGARTGTSDQATMVLGKLNTMVNVTLLAEELDSSGARYLPFPDDLALLVINSFTQRSLSGAQLAAYTRNRFAYSMALEILRQELSALGYPPDHVKKMDRLSQISPEALGGAKSFYQILLRIPQELSLLEMRQRYVLPGFDEAYEQYFGGVPPEQRPSTIGIRGPLLFGIAESERARAFLPALESGDFSLAGKLMTAGHNGDRIRNEFNEPYVRSVSDQDLHQWAASETPIIFCPGDYGASSAVLDTLVDTALRAGALGACLTGAGLAGTVLALCRKKHTAQILESIQNKMASEHYTRLANLPAPLRPIQLSQAAVINHAPDGAGELCLPS